MLLAEQQLVERQLLQLSAEAEAETAKSKEAGTTGQVRAAVFAWKGCRVDGLSAAVSVLPLPSAHSPLLRHTDLLSLSPLRQGVGHLPRADGPHIRHQRG